MGVLQRDVDRRARAHRQAGQDRGADAEVVEESGDVVGRAEGPGGVGGGAVAAGVGHHDPVGGGEGGYLGVPHAVVQEAAVQQHQGGAGATGVAVGEVAVAGGEETEVRVSTHDNQRVIFCANMATEVS